MTYNQWFKKNWFTVLAIFFIIMVVMWHQNDIDKSCFSKIVECNEHWKGELNRVCPNFATDGYSAPKGRVYVQNMTLEKIE